MDKETIQSSSLQIAVVGGGPAGVATALALLDRGMAVTLIERSDYQDLRVGEHLSPEAVPFLGQLGVLEVVKQGDHRSCPGVRSVWGASTPGDNAYLFNPYGDGFNLSRPGFDALLAAQAEQRGATLFKTARLHAADLAGDSWTLAVRQNGHSFTHKANFLVDATGRAAAIARLFKQKQIVYDRLVGLVGLMMPSTAGSQLVDDTLLIEACQDGWWYIARLLDGRSVAAYMTDADLVSGAADEPLAFWRARLEQSSFTRALAEAFALPEEIHIRSARSQRCETIVGPGWLAVGDAAISFDPLSSAGISKGFKWGIQAAEAIQAHFNGDTTALPYYEQSVIAAFADYLSTRAYYYRQEQRWPDSPFWRRRHRPLLSEMPITLDPMTIVTTPQNVDFKEVQAFLETEQQFGSDGGLLSRLATSPQPAHRLATQFKAASTQSHTDRQIISAIQFLLQSGFLVKVKPE